MKEITFVNILPSNFHVFTSLLSIGTRITAARKVTLVKTVHSLVSCPGPYCFDKITVGLLKALTE